MATAATQQAQSGGLKAYFEANRVLQTYPTGWSRWWMLTLTVLATIVSYYEFGFSAMLPLWMPALHFTLADRHGRVVVIDLCLAVMIVLTFANLLMTGFWSFVVVRGLMNLVAGLMWGALGGLTRDMSPRLSRGAAFGLLTVGAVTCQWLWAFVPGVTLPIFHTWQSQIVIMGVLAVILYVPVLLWLKDLSPSLRMMVMDSETMGAAYESGEAAPETPAPEVTGSAMHAFSQLLGKWEVWILVAGVVAFLTVPMTIQTFGPLMFEQAFGYDHATADKAAANFWLLNLVMLVPAGWFSDRLRVRKPVTLVMTLV